MTDQPGTLPLVLVDSEHILGVNTQTALERLHRPFHLGDALGCCRLRDPGAETLIQRLSLCLQRGGALGQRPPRLCYLVLLCGQLC